MPKPRPAATAPAPAPPSPGALCRAKRVEYGWSVLEIAPRLCLSIAQLEALEGDDYQNLPGRTYILGYWKNYANLLDISIDDSVAVHRKNLFGDAYGVATETAQQRRGTEKAYQGFAAGFAVLSLALLTLIWYWNNASTDASLGATRGGVPSTQASAQATGTTETPVEPPVLDPRVTLPEPNFSPNLSLGNGGDGALSETNIAPAGIDTSSTQHGVTILGAGGNGPSPTDEGEVIPTLQSISPNKIILAVGERSWIEVRDDAGQRLLYRTVNPGQRVTLEGKPPFLVFVSNARGVVVEYRGRAIPVEARARKRFARLQIGDR